MEYYTILGVVVACLVSIIGVYISVKKRIKDEQKPLNDLNLNITRLTLAIENMQKNDDIRDKRIEKHGAEIDDLKQKTATHDTRITKLEEWRNER